MNELALFAGVGGGILGGQLLGWRTVCAVECEPYPASVLAARQNDGLLPPFPIWSDVRTFDGRPWRGVVDVVSGGFPCQDISAAGKGAGIEGERSGLWSHMARIVGEVRPRFVFVENSPMLITRGLGRVVTDLAALGYGCRWAVLGAADVGAPHQRDRFWLVAHAAGFCDCRKKHGDEVGGADSIRPTGGAGRSGCCSGSRTVAHADSLRELQPQGRECDERRRSCYCGSHVADADLSRFTNCEGGGESEGLTWNRAADYASSADGGRDGWRLEPNVGRMVDGLAARVDRLKAIGNGQVPLCAAAAFRELVAAFD